jgi:hypothetical protein
VVDQKKHWSSAYAASAIEVSCMTIPMHHGVAFAQVPTKAAQSPIARKIKHEKLTLVKGLSSSVIRSSLLDV